MKSVNRTEKLIISQREFLLILEAKSRVKIVFSAR